MADYKTILYQKQRNAAVITLNRPNALNAMNQDTPETVVQTYQSHRDKGWGVIAKALGIKPGSRAFHALKRGNLVFDGVPAEDRPKGKGKGKGSGK